MFKRYSIFLLFALCMQTTLIKSSITFTQDFASESRRKSAADLSTACWLWNQKENMPPGEEIQFHGALKMRIGNVQPYIQLTELGYFSPLCSQESDSPSKERKSRWSNNGITWEIDKIGGIVRKKTAESIKTYKHDGTELTKESTTLLRTDSTTVKKTPKKAENTFAWSPRRSFFVTLIVGITGLKWWSQYKQSAK